MVVLTGLYSPELMPRKWTQKRPLVEMSKFPLSKKPAFPDSDREVIQRCQMPDVIKRAKQAPDKTPVDKVCQRHVCGARELKEMPVLAELAPENASWQHCPRLGQRRLSQDRAGPDSFALTPPINIIFHLWHSPSSTHAARKSTPCMGSDTRARTSARAQTHTAFLPVKFHYHPTLRVLAGSTLLSFLLSHPVASPPPGRVGPDSPLSHPVASPPSILRRGGETGEILMRSNLV